MGRNVSAGRLTFNVRRHAAAVALISNDVHLGRELSIYDLSVKNEETGKANFYASSADYCNEIRIRQVACYRCPFSRLRLIKIAGQGYQGIVPFGLGRYRIHTKIDASSTSFRLAIIVRFRDSFVDAFRRIVIHRGVSIFKSSSAQARACAQLNLCLTLTSAAISGRRIGGVQLFLCHLNLARLDNACVRCDVRQALHYLYRVRELNVHYVRDHQ